MGRVTHDYAGHMMKFQLDEKMVLLVGDKSLALKMISFNQLQAMCETGDLYGIYEIYSLQKKYGKINNGFG